MNIPVLFTCIVAYAKVDWSLIMRIYYQKRNQAMIPITSEILNIISLLEDISMVPDTCDLTNTFSPPSISKDEKKLFPSHSRNINMPLLS